MRKTWIFLLVFITVQLKAQLDSLAHLQYDVRLNDIWGYQDDLGNEYALVGLVDGISIVDVTQPDSIREVFRSKGPNSLWRDIKVYNGFAYVTNESDSGLRIYRIDGLPDVSTVEFKNFMGEGDQIFNTAHNLYIDSSGYAYVVGTDRSDEMIVFDLNANPWSPNEVGFFGANYIHDIYVRNDTAFASAIVEGEIQILDVTEKANIQLLSSHNTEYRQTHNSWLSNDGNYLFTTDEINGAPVEVFDISDKFDPERVETYKVRQFGDEIAHNVLVNDSLLFIAYYKTGLVLVDCTYPYNLVELAVFDTDKSSKGPGFSGAWGVYPFLKSGHILVSDINNGLYVLKFNPTNIGYLEGNVMDAMTGFPLNNVKYQIIGSSEWDYTPFTGSYSLGQKGGGEIEVVFSAYGYQTDTIRVNLIEDSVHFESLSLQKKNTGEMNFSITGDDGKQLDRVSLTLSQSEFSQEFSTDERGELLLDDLPIGQYEVNVGKWGYRNGCVTISVNEGENRHELQLVSDYFDDFSANQGWISSSVTGDAIWERVTPVASFDNNQGLQYDPSEDGTLEGCNGKAFCTGIDGYKSAESSTVNYTNYIVSPEVSVPSIYTDAYLSFKYWSAFQENSEDTLKFGVISENDTVFVEFVSETDPQREWISRGFNLSDAAISSGTFRFIVEISDDLNPWHLVDAAIDDFEVQFISGKEDVNTCFVGQNGIWKSKCGVKNYRILNNLGQIVQAGVSSKFDFSNLNSGVYMLQIEGYAPQKVVVDE